MLELGCGASLVKKFRVFSNQKNMAEPTESQVETDTDTESESEEKLDGDFICLFVFLVCV